MPSTSIKRTRRLLRRNVRHTGAANSRAPILLTLVMTLSACAPRNLGIVPVQTILDGRIEVLPEFVDTGSPVSSPRVRTLLGAPLSADDAVEIALLNNARLQSELEGLNLAHAVLQDAGLLPNLEFEADFASVQGTSTSEFGFLLSTNLSQLFLRSLRRDVASSELAATRIETAGTVLAFAETTRRAFYAYQAAEQLLELAQTVVAASEASHAVAERLFEAGNLTTLELANERSFFEEARSEAFLAEAEVVASREVLHTLMGLSRSETDWMTVPRLADPDEDRPSLETIEGMAIDRSLDLAALDSRYAAAANRASLSRAEGLLPSLRAGVHTDHEGGSREFGPVISVEIPLFNRGQGAIAAARTQMRQLEQRYRAREVEIQAAARAIGGRVAIAAERAEHYRDVRLPLQEQIVEQTQLQYNAMQSGVFELIAARREQVRTAEGYVMALRDYWMARTTLDQLVAGRLVPTGESFGGRWIQPE